MKRYLLICFFLSSQIWAIDWEDLTEFPDGAYKNYEATQERAKIELALIAKVQEEKEKKAEKPEEITEVKKETPAPTPVPASSPVLDLINEDSVPLSQSGIKKDEVNIPVDEIKPLWSFPQEHHGRRPHRKKSR